MRTLTVALAGAVAMGLALSASAEKPGKAEPKSEAKADAKGSDAKPDAKPALDAKPAPAAKPKTNDDSLDSLLQQASPDPPSTDGAQGDKAAAKPDPAGKPAGAAKADPAGKGAAKADPAGKGAAKADPVKSAKPAEPEAPPTDDNDTTGEASRPKALEAVRPTTKPRLPGPYELSDLDCRMLDGAGIERVLPKRMTTGEEPDLLCRVLVTQPATVAAATHTLTLTVALGQKATYQQVRNVRIGSVGRRAIVFVVPADRISSEDPAKVTMRAVLSGPAKPPMREVRFTIEPAD